MTAFDLFREHGTGAVSDALDLLELNGGLLGLVHRSGREVTCGPAYTLRYEPVAAGERGPAGEFIDDVPAGSVVVIANGGRMYCTVWGDILSEVAGYRGVAGAVIDGCCRDLDKIRALGFPLWSRGVYMKSGKNRIRLTAVQEPVAVADTLVRPGDVVCADGAGVVVIPQDRVGEVTGQIKRVTEMESRVRGDIARGVALREARQRHGYNLAAVPAIDRALGQTSMRALIGGIVHESSTFVLQASGPTVLEDFEVHAGQGMTEAFGGTNTVTGGYLAACGQSGVTVAPTLHARAEPGAAVDPASYQALQRRLLDLAEAAGKTDLILLDLHGAGTLVSRQSLDLALVRALRALAGPDAVLGITLDLHANLPPELVSLTDIIVGFQEYPHTDMASRAELTVRLAAATARGDLKPVVRKLTLPMLLPPSSTLSGPAAEARELAQKEETAEGVLACTVFHGFPYVDTEYASTSVVTVANGSAALAGQVNARIGKWLWDNKERFLIRTVPPEQAVSEALASGGTPVVIGDGTDNPGSGALGDSTYLLRALLDSGARACLATLHDPAAVAAAVTAGPGARIEIAVGGRHGRASGPPVPVHATVRSITDGQVTQQSMRRGKKLDFGRSARLDTGQVDIIVSSKRRQVLDPEILILHGIVPQRYDIIAVKSVNHFRAGFAAISAGLLVADAPGPMTRDIISLHKDGPAAALWPMNAVSFQVMEETRLTASHAGGAGRTRQ